MNALRQVTRNGKDLRAGGKTLYTLGSRLGKGAAGEVFQCCTPAGEAFAIKRLKTVELHHDFCDLRWCFVLKEGLPLEHESDATFEDIFWLSEQHSSSKEIAVLKVGSQFSELDLPTCVRLFGLCPSKGARVPYNYRKYLSERAKQLGEVKSAWLLRGLQSVVQLEEVLEEHNKFNTTMYLVMELAQGGDLYSYLENQGKGVLADELQPLTLQLLATVHELHSRGIAHRDLKLDNVVLAVDERPSMDEGQEPLVKLCDLGLALRSQAWDGGFICRNRVGTAGYMSPEMFHHNDPYDSRHADVWAVGVIIYTLLAGHPPFEKDTRRCPRYRHYRAWQLKHQPTRRPLNASLDQPELAWAPSWFFPAGLPSTVQEAVARLLQIRPEQRLQLKDRHQLSWFADESIPVDAAPVAELVTGDSSPTCVEGTEKRGYDPLSALAPRPAKRMKTFVRDGDTADAALTSPDAMGHEGM